MANVAVGTLSDSVEENGAIHRTDTVSTQELEEMSTLGSRSGR